MTNYKTFKILFLAKDGDWTSMLVEYAANKSGLGGIMGDLKPKEPQKKQPETGKLGLK